MPPPQIFRKIKVEKNEANIITQKLQILKRICCAEFSTAVRSNSSKRKFVNGQVLLSPPKDSSSRYCGQIIFAAPVRRLVR